VNGRSPRFNFLEQPELLAPAVSAAQAEQLLATHYGITARAEPLGSQQDKNFLVFGADGEHLGVLKIANPAFSAVELEAQDAAAQLIAEAHPAARVSLPLPNLAGQPYTAVTGLLDGTAYARLLHYLPGGTLVDDGYLAPDVVAGMGELAGHVSRALAGFDHPGLDRVLQWDLRYGKAVVDQLNSHVADTGQRNAIGIAATEAWSHIEQFADALPRQAVHLDLTDANIVASRTDSGGKRPDGIIDFGDLSDTWTVSELAITMSSVLGHSGTGPASILPGVNAFHSLRPLTEVEAEVLWPLLVLRMAVLLVSDAQQAALDPDNEYVVAQTDAQWRMFEQATSVPIEVMTALLKAELGFATGGEPLEGAPLTGLDPASVVTLDLSATSTAFDCGSFGVSVEDDAARSAVRDGAALVVTRFGEPRLTRAPFLSRDAPDVVATGVWLWPALTMTLAAPWPGDLIRHGDAVTVRGEHHDVSVTNCVAVSGDRVEAGAAFATIDENAWATVTVQPVDAPRVPVFTSPELAAGWLAVARDPRPLLGLSAQSLERQRNLLARRDQAFARVQEHYYREPPQIERGWRHYLMSTSGRVYLDMVNNVTVLGHAHPRVADAANRQLRRLNTNSRFNYEAVVEFSERLAATLPGPLDTVFLVNSGSEASDLALRLAMAATERRDVLAVREAYHGWTYATDAVSTSTADNPNALTTRPDWVYTVESPNSFRGMYRGAEVGEYAADAVRQVEQMVAAGRAPAAFICEPVYGNAGGMALPDGYLAQVYAAVRAHGGLAIADEVQVGYGRLGHWFWGFHQQGVVPDIVSVAKSTGNGYPLGAVITSRAVADAFSAQGYFFSSTGGSPLSCTIGLTVLDVLADEDLQGNALRVGEHLKTRLLALRGRHPIVGTVHGTGLYLGVELIRDLDTLTPATEETAAICDRMLELGVVIQPTGDHMNILKTKPPLCIDVAGADFYVDALDRVLSEGW
jgi:4-aminobutyrate aminotransferase-like enzyme/Ser/Thr protein kinase RdoA (MazF antagonist)